MDFAGDDTGMAHPVREPSGDDQGHVRASVNIQGHGVRERLHLGPDKIDASSIAEPISKPSIVSSNAADINKLKSKHTSVLPEHRSGPMHRGPCSPHVQDTNRMLCVTVRVASALRSSFNATVAQDTSGGYTRTTQAIAAAPVLPQRRDHTETKPGIYDEQVDVWINKTYIAPIGDDASTTKITRSRPRARGFSEIDDPGRQDCGRGCAEFGEAIRASKIHIFRNKFPKVWIFQCLAASTKWVIAPFRSGCSNLQCPLTSLSKSVWAVSMASIRERLYINPRVYLPVVSIRIGR
ncbi:hypothetical protein RJ640_027514 [Escallonia rubra]|uniref:Pectinesterase catalytic domain-containing protein n=1 Tax=Escallonia rubra TaxID=112253 RepID=A0AA88U713_9ASTE|nr:hypothetical protein RJ640_027514 [Escallonia rubra]